MPDTEIKLDRADNGQGNGNNNDGCQPGRTGREQAKRKMKERFHSFVVPQIRKFGKIASRQGSEAPTPVSTRERVPRTVFLYVIMSFITY